MSEGEIKIQIKVIIDRWRLLDEVVGDAPQLIKALRQVRGLSQEQLARAIGVDKTYISQIDRGIRQPSLELLERIVAYLGESDV